jgi:hypothetical protein
MGQALFLSPFCYICAEVIIWAFNLCLIFHLPIFLFGAIIKPSKQTTDDKKEKKQ